MAIKIFIDANVLLDLILKRECYKDAKQLFTLIEENRLQGYITSSVLHIVGYWVTKELGVVNAKRILLNLLTFISVIDIKHETAVLALHSRIDDIEDALQYYTAIHHKLDYFVTRDKPLQKNGIPVLPVVAPQALINQLNNLPLP